jgi:hypothetical protein
MSRLSRLAGAAVALAVTLGLPAAAHADPSYYPSGPQTDVPRATPVAGGWQVCYQGSLADTDIPLDPLLADCDGDFLMLAGGWVGAADYMVLAAAPRADVLWDPGNSQSATKLANGSEWYFDEDAVGAYGSWGFAPEGAMVWRGPDDLFPAADKMTWLLSSDGMLIAGPRIGEQCDAPVWYPDCERVILEAFGELRAVGSPSALTFGAQPRSMVSPRQTVTFSISTTTQQRELGRLAVTGVNADEFDIVGTPDCPAQAPADGSTVTCTVALRFIPQAQGARTAQLGFANVPGDAVALTGTGGPLPTGPQGPQGHDGQDGADGADGKDGVNGNDGTKGDRGRRRGAAVCCRVRRYRAGSRAVCTFTRKVRRRQRVQLRDRRGRLATARGRNSRRVVFISKRRAAGRLRVVVTVGRNVTHPVKRSR